MDEGEEGRVTPGEGGDNSSVGIGTTFSGTWRCPAAVRLISTITSAMHNRILWCGSCRYRRSTSISSKF